MAARHGAREAASRPDFDPGAPPKTRFRLAPYLTFGAKIELEYEFARNLDLNDAEDDNLSLLTPEVELAFSFDPSTRLQAFLNLELSQEFALTGPRELERRLRIELKEAFLFFKDLAAGRLALQIGRQRFNDDREWLYDEELDAVRLFARLADLELQLSVSRNGLFRKDFADADSKELINNYLLYGRYRLGDEVVLAGYAFLRDDRSPERERPIFFGLHSSGDLSDKLEYWLELAHVRGREGSRKIRGWGLDVGLTYVFGFCLRPSVTVAYAFGSGDGDPDDRVDRHFRQTGLQENEARFSGVTRIQYYGELLDPELSNLAIFTGGIGIRPTKRSSIDLVYHYYLQGKVSTSIRGAEIDADPSGLSKRLGSEIDLVVGYEELKGIEVKWVLGYFIPGKAFPKAASSFLTTLKIEWNF
jgi:alginate production protein